MSPAGRIDSMGMASAVAALPEQLTAALAADPPTGLPAHDSLANVVLLGNGDDGGAAALVAAVVTPYSSVPVTLVDGLQLPSYVGPDSLVVAFSWSGGSAEVVDSAGGALDAGARLLVVAGDGPLTELGSKAGVAVAQVGGDAPVARTAVAAMAVPALLALEEVGLYPGARQWVEMAVEQVRRRRDALSAPGNLAVDVARRIGRTFPLVYSAGAVGEAAGRHWKSRFNQNAKIPSWWATAPALVHDDLAGFGQHGDVTRQILTLVTLRHDEEHPQMADALDAVAAVVDEVVADVIEVRAEGDGELAQLLDLMLIGNFVSLELAAHEGVDPGPTASLERLRAAIGA